MKRREKTDAPPITTILCEARQCSLRSCCGGQIDTIGDYSGKNSRESRCPNCQWPEERENDLIRASLAALVSIISKSLTLIPTPRTCQTASESGQNTVGRSTLPSLGMWTVPTINTRLGLNSSRGLLQLFLDMCIIWDHAAVSILTIICAEFTAEIRELKQTA